MAPHPGPLGHPHGHPAPGPPAALTFGKDGQAVRDRRGAILFRASGARRWWARIIDAVLVVTVSLVIIAAAALAAGDAVGMADDSPILMLLGFAAYPVIAFLAGMLYGRGCSIGQAMAGVVSLRCESGRLVGAWRGGWRYLGIAVLPLTIFVLIISILDLGPGYDEAVRVYRRRA